MERADNKPELLTAIRRFYGDNYLINKYGQQYGTTDINLLAEEQLADGFSDYYNGKLNGETTQRLAARLHIPQRIVAIYDRITEAIRGLIGKQDIIRPNGNREIQKRQTASTWRRWASEDDES